MTWTFHPNFAAMRTSYSTDQCKAQSWPSSLESRLTRRVERHLSHLVEFFKNQIVVFRVQANPRIADDDLYARNLFIEYARVSAYGHTSTIRCIFDRVDHQVIQRFLDEGNIPIDIWGIFVVISSKPDPSAFGGFGKAVNYIANQQWHSYGSVPDVQKLGINASNIQHHIDDFLDAI